MTEGRYQLKGRLTNLARCLGHDLEATLSSRLSFDRVNWYLGQVVQLSEMIPRALSARRFEQSP